MFLNANQFLLLKYETKSFNVPEAIFVAKNSETYEDCIKNAIILGEDTDTQAAIAEGI